MNPEIVVRDDSNATKLGNYVKGALTEKGLKFATTSTEVVQVLFFRGSKLEITLRIFCGDTFLTLHGTLPLMFSENSMPELLVYLNSLSIGMPIGAYEIHPETRLLAFKVGLSVPPEPTADQLSSLVYLVVESLDSVSSHVIKLSEGAEQSGSDSN